MIAENPHGQVGGSKWAVISAISAGVVAVLVSIAHTFTNSSIVHFRDLGHYSLPFTRWMRRTVASGHLPLWNPESGLGFSAISDPTLQLLFPPTLILRLLLPESLGLNLSVSLAIVVAFAGALTLFARRGDVFAATAGALVFALSGPVLSAANMLNLGWSVALAPWVVLAAVRVTDSRELARVGALAVAVALQILAGEPMTAAAALFAALGVALSDATDGRAAVRSMCWILPGVGLGIALSGIQLLPLVTASLASTRGANLLVDTWSLHPATLVEAVLPDLFGTPVGPGTSSPMWYRSLNGGRDPLILSVYVGVPALALAGAALGDEDERRRRTSLVWLAILSVAVVLALGDFAPILPALRDHVPGASMARFPSKFICIAALALSALVCVGVQVLCSRTRPRAAVCIALGVSALGIVLAVAAALAGADGSSSETIGGWAAALQIPRSGHVVGELAERLSSEGLSLGLYSALTVSLVLLVVSRRLPEHVGPAVLGGLAVLPLLVAGPSRCLPVIARTSLPDPVWASEVDRTGRVFVSAGPGLAFTSNVHPAFRVPDGATRAAAGSIYGATFPVFATGLGLTDAVTTDLAQLRPKPYADFLGRFDAATPVERRRVLERLGVSDLVVPFEPAPPMATLVARTPELPEMAHWRIPNPSPRVWVVPKEEQIGDPQAQTSRLFSEWFDPSARVILGAVTEAPLAEDNSAGSTAVDRASTATLIAESPSTLVIEAEAPEGGGWLVVNDAWANGWIATVDGAPAQVARANGIVRAVRLSAGTHVVRLSYRPTPLIAGSIVTGVAGLFVLGLLGYGHFGRRKAPS